MTTALDGLREMIASGELSAGARFPPEADLCARLGVSRSSLREAVRILSTLGVIEVRHGSGTFVSRLDPADIVRGFALTVELLPLDGLLQLFEIRRVLESHTTAQAAARASDALIAELDAIAGEMETCSDPAELGELDRRFHHTISEAAGNATITSLMDVFRSRGSRYRILGGADDDPVRRASDAGHRAIVDAIAKRDPPAAATAAAAHVAQTEYWLGLLQPQPHDPAR